MKEDLQGIIQWKLEEELLFATCLYMQLKNSCNNIF
jgi:hypothetical protein